MYIKKSVLLFKIKNILFYVGGIFWLTANVEVLVSLYATYYDDMQTFWNAKATPQCISGIQISIIAIIIAYISGRMIGQVHFYSNYFELDLDGIVSYEDLAKACGRNPWIVKLELRLYRMLYMKNFKMRDKENIALESKTVQCECRSCGAPVDKMIYFAGQCSYCGSLDVFAKVLVDNHIYSIEKDCEGQIGKPEYYLKKNIQFKIIKGIVDLGIISALVIIAICAIVDNATHMNDEEYLRQAILTGKGYSYKLIQQDMMGLIIWFSMLIIAMIPATVAVVSKLVYISRSKKCAIKFAKAKKAYITKSEIPLEKRPIAKVCRLIKKGYAKNCAIESVKGKFRISLAKRVVKDKCPYCGAPIMNVKNEYYTCPYCSQQVLGVVDKKQA